MLEIKGDVLMKKLFVKVLTLKSIDITFMGRDFDDEFCGMFGENVVMILKLLVKSVLKVLEN